MWMSIAMENKSFTLAKFHGRPGHLTSIYKSSWRMTLMYLSQTTPENGRSGLENLYKWNSTCLTKYRPGRATTEFGRVTEVSYLYRNAICNISVTNKMYFNVYDVLYSLNSHQHVSAANVAIFRLMYLLKEYKGTNVVNCVAVTP
jgi:hypothetical protein